VHLDELVALGQRKGDGRLLDRRRLGGEATGSEGAARLEPRAER